MTEQTKINTVDAEIVGAGGGKKGGGKAVDNTLTSKAIARIVEALSEGPIVGLVEGPRSIYFDETPLQNEDGSWNFDNIVWDQRKGNPDDTHLNGHSAVEVTNPVETDVEVATGPVITSVVNQNADAVRVIIRVNSLFKVDENGQPQKNSLNYKIEIRPLGGTWVEMVNQDLVDEKCTSPVQMAHRIELPVGSNPWDIRVTRVTPDSTNEKDQSSITFESFVTCIEGRFTYPHTAAVALQIEAESVGQSVPQRAYKIMGRIISVPSNYDPTTRVYTGIWDGNFKLAWSNNPAWIFYDLLQNDRYGLGEHISEVEMSSLKWRLYTIAQYCDQMIPSGFKDDQAADILEPRFTFNGVIRNRQEAYHALQAITTSFRGMGYWALGQIFATADMPADPVKLVTPANVLNGRFSYSSTALKARHSVAIVRWNDPNDFYRPATEMVINNEALRKFGWREKRMDFLGCTSRGLAHRYGKWALDVENTETETVEYKAGFDHLDIAPGDIISIADPRKASVRMGGRVVSHEYHTADRDLVTLDAEIALEEGAQTDTFIWLTRADGTLMEVEVKYVLTGKTTLRVEKSAEYVAANSVFIVTATDVVPRQYRVLSINETDENIFQITGLFHDPTKYDRIEQGISFDPLPYSRDDKARKVQNLAVSEVAFVDDDGVTRTKTMLTWEAPSGVVVREYAVQADTPTEVKRFLTSTKNTNFEIENLERGDYTFYVTTIDRQGRVSPPESVNFTITTTDSISAGVVSNLLLTDANGSTEFFGRDVRIQWRNLFPKTTGGVATEENPALYDYNTVEVYHQPTNTLLRTETVRGNTLTYSFDQNTRDCAAAALSVDAARNLRFEVTVTSKRATTSAPSSLTVSNPVPDALLPTVSNTGQTISVGLPASAATDIRGMKVWIEPVTGFDPNVETPKFDGTSGFMTWVGLPDTTYYIRAGYFDFFDDTMSVSAEVPITLPALNLPTNPATPVNLNLSTELLANNMARVTATWDANSESDLAGYDLLFAENTGDYVSFQVVTETKYWDVLPGTDIKVRVRARSTESLVSSYTTVEQIIAAKDSVAPAVPTGLVVTGAFEGFWLSWAKNSEADLSHYEVRRKASNVAPANQSTTVDIVTQNANFFEGGYTGQVTRYFWLRAVDTSGNISDWAPVVSATTTVVDTEITTEKLIGLVDQTSMANGLTNIEIVGTLPTTGNFEGRTVTLTTDGKIYRYHSGAWTAAVNTSDIAGQLSNAQILDGAISIAKFAAGLTPNEIVSTLPGTGNFEGRTVFLTSDGKIYRYASGAWTATVATSDLTGTITETQITDGAIATPKLAANAVTTAKIAANAVTADEIAANTITAGQIAAAAITATEMAAGSITVEKLAIGTFDNLNLDVDFNDTSSWTGATIVAAGSPDAWGSKNYAKIEGLGTSADNVYGPVFRLNPDGEELRIRARVRSQNADGTADVLLQTSATEDFAVPNNIGLGISDASGVLQDATVTKVIAAGTLFARIRLRKSSDGCTDARFGGIEIRRRNGGELIVDGAITADHIAAETITGDKIAANTLTADKLVANSITAAQIAAGAIGAAQIAAGAITATKMAIGDFTNLNPDRDYLDAALWSGNDGIVDTTNTDWLSTRYMKILSDGVSNEFVYGPKFQVTPGDELWVSFTSKVQAGTGTVNMNLQFSADEDMATVTHGWPGVGNTSTAVVTNEGSVTVPAGMRWAQIRVYNVDNGITEGRVGAIYVRRKAVGSLIVDGAITANKLTTGEVITLEAQIKDAIITNAKIVDATIEGAKIKDATITSAKIDTITADKITVSGVTSLADWRYGGDNTLINGGVIAANTILANSVHIGMRGITAEQVFEADPSTNQVSWTGGRIDYIGDDGNAASVFASSGNATWTTGILYVYWTKDATTLGAVEGINSVPANSVILATYRGGSDLNESYGRTVIDGDYIRTGAIVANHIATNTITATQIAANTITATQIAAATITANEIAANTITANQIAANTLTANEMAAATITADRLAFGTGGGNMVPNSDFSQGLFGYHQGGTGVSNTETTMSLRTAGNGYAGRTYPTLELYQNGTSTDGYTNVWLKQTDPDGTSSHEASPVQAGKTYQARMQLSFHRCDATVYVTFYDTTGTLISTTTVEAVTDGGVGEQYNPDAWAVRWKNVTAPTGAATARLFVRKYGTKSGTNSYLFVHKPQLVEVPDADAPLAPYSVGPITVLDGTSIVTGSLTADAVNTTSFAASGLAIFGDDLRSDDFVTGSAGWIIDKDGNAEFNDLIVRSSLVEGSVSDGGSVWQNGGAIYDDEESVASVTLGGAPTADALFQIHANAQIRRKGTYTYISGTDKEGDPVYTTINANTTFVLRERTKVSGVWGSWTELYNSGADMDDTWTEHQSIHTKIYYDVEDVQWEIACLISNDTLPANEEQTNMRRIGIAVRAVRR